MATRISASLDWAASARRGQGVAEVAARGVGRQIDSIACPDAARSVVAFATIRAVRPASITLTWPPFGRSLSASRAAPLATVSRSGATSVAAMLADVSMISDKVPGQPGWPLQERSRGKGREEQRRAGAGAGTSRLRRSRLPRRVCLDVGGQPLPEQRGRHDRLGSSEAEQVHRDDGRQEQQPEQGERGR